MKRSTERILTTHCGSLIRTAEIIRGMRARTLHQPLDEEQFAIDIRDGIKQVVLQQVEAGIDIPNDGEYARAGYTSYVQDRLTGLAPRPPDPADVELDFQAERAEFPGFFTQYDKHFRHLWMLPEVHGGVAEIPAQAELFEITGRIAYKGQSSVDNDISALKSALDGLPIADAFITAVTPTTRKSDKQVLEVYPSMQEYLYALADALHEEYQAITDAGFVLQLDRSAQGPIDTLPWEERRRAMELSVEVLNHALRGIPEELVRYHHCGGSGNRPHTTDAPLTEFLPVMLKIKAQAYGIEAANPRHEHEWMVWQDVKLPEGKILIPGLVSQSTNVVEHPDLVAWRIRNFASVVGKENVIAGVDCGFSTFWDTIRVHPSVQWAKLRALADGAARASEVLWGQ
jgi:5-methyltetrahydropteroyltriglutamate--homocysteine methyltransferase